jgi:hypothetical protein
VRCSSVRPAIFLWDLLQLGVEEGEVEGVPWWLSMTRWQGQRMAMSCGAALITSYRGG